MLNNLDWLLMKDIFLLGSIVLLKKKNKNEKVVVKDVRLLKKSV